MRDIKFRVWSHVHKKMWRGGIQLNNIDEKGIVSVGLLDESYQHETHFLRPGFDTPVEATLMQFTGLFDKNGVEIYESDLLQPVYPLEGNPSAVRWEGAAFVIGISFVLGMPPFQPRNFEVVGNIYQHGHLLGNESKEV